jgi:hypothetical protein
MAERLEVVGMVRAEPLTRPARGGKEEKHFETKGAILRDTHIILVGGRHWNVVKDNFSRVTG